MNMICKELDKINMGAGSFIVSRTIQSIERSNNNLKQSLIQHLDYSTANRNANKSQRIINQTVLNPDRILQSTLEKVILMMSK